MLEKLLKSAKTEFNDALNLLMLITLGKWYGQMSATQIMDIFLLQRNWLKQCDENPDLAELKSTFEGHLSTVNRLCMEFEQDILEDAHALLNLCDEEDEAKKRIKAFATAFKDVRSADPEWETLAQ